MSYTIIVEGMDERERAAFDAKLTPAPDQATAAQRPRSTGTRELMRLMASQQR